MERCRIAFGHRHCRICRSRWFLGRFCTLPRQADSLKFRLKYVEDQLANFYGPLLGLLKEFEAAHSTVVAIFALPPATHIDAAYCATNAGVSKQEVSKVFRPIYFHTTSASYH